MAFHIPIYIFSFAIKVDQQHLRFTEIFVHYWKDFVILISIMHLSTFYTKFWSQFLSKSAHRLLPKYTSAEQPRPAERGQEWQGDSLDGLYSSRLLLLLIIFSLQVISRPFTKIGHWQLLKVDKGPNKLFKNIFSLLF